MMNDNKKTGFWAAVAAVGSAIIAVLLCVLFRKSPPAPAPKPTPAEKATEKIEEIQAKTDAEIVEEHTTPAEKEHINDIVDTQVDKAMQSAAKYRRKKQ